MTRQKIRMSVTGVVNVPSANGTFLLILHEEEGERILSIPVGQFEAQTLLVELRGIEPSRPLMHMLFAAVLNVMDVKLLHILIYKVENGVFYSYLYLKSEEAMIRVDARPSDAVALALQTHAPILVYEDLLDGNDTADGEGNPGTDMEHPETYDGQTREKTLEVLKKAMQKAVDKEDYERAALLRDRIKSLEERTERPQERN